MCVCVWGGGGRGGARVVGSLSFGIQGQGVYPNSDPFGQSEKGGRGSAKIGHFSRMLHKCMVPK